MQTSPISFVVTNHPSIYPTTFHQPSIQLSNYVTNHPSNYSTMSPIIHPSKNQTTQPSLQPFNHITIHSSIYTSIHPSNHPSIHSSNHPFNLNPRATKEIGDVCTQATFWQVMELCPHIFQNLNSGNCHRTEWNIKPTTQSTKREGITNTANAKGDTGEQLSRRLKRVASVVVEN